VKKWFGLTIKVLAVAALLLLVSPINQAQAGRLYDRLTPMQKRLLSGFASSELDPQNALGPQTPSSPGAFSPASPSIAGTSYMPGEDGCPKHLGDNIKVNENCLNISNSNLQGRSQAQNETAIAADPLNGRHLVASYNDYRRGDGTCGVGYSLDGGKTWQDGTTPNGFTSGAAFGGKPRQYWHAGGDTSVAWDSRGNAYLDCQVFMRGPATTNNPDQSSAIYVFRSTGNNGASWNFTGRPVIETYDTTGTILQDKPYLTVDNSMSSSFRDRVYVSWTEFAANGTGYIYASHSNDYGQSFSAKVVVSTDSVLCPTTFGIPTPNGRCNENQFSQPFTAPDGTLYVVFDNYNNAVTGADNRNQVLISKSTDGGVTFSAPVKVADFYDLPNCDTYQGAGADPFRACVPEKGGTNSVFRAANYPSGAVNPDHPLDIAVSFGSYINTDSQEPNCVPAGLVPLVGTNLFTGVKSTPGCTNGILLSVSHNGGASFTGTTTDPRTLTDITHHDNQKKADRFWQWLAFSASGRLAVSYYDRMYGDDEMNGFSDISLSSSSNLTSFHTQRVTSSSNPPPTQFNGPFGGQFLGDYSGLAVTEDGDKSQRPDGSPGVTAYPFWSDTRDVDLFLCPGTGTPGVPPTVCTKAAVNATVANDEDVFTAIVHLNGHDE
jgi:hypothetical protein